MPFTLTTANPPRPSSRSMRKRSARAVARTCVCPAGNARYRKGASRVVNGDVSEQFRGTMSDCGACPLRAQCLRTPETTRVRNVAFIRERVLPKPETASARMRARIDTAAGRARYGGRCGAVEPVSGNLRHNKRLALRAAGSRQGRWAVAAVLPSAQHRETRPPRVRSLARSSASRRNTARHRPIRTIHTQNHTANR